VLGYYLTSAHDGRRSGVLPPPVFDAALLQGQPIAFTHWDGYAANLPLFAAAAPGVAERSGPSPAEEALRVMDPDGMSPREAMDALYRLKGLLG
jgi:hypothetical protein